MDRNYFLSYGRIAFLLLLSTIGKLNARFISVTTSSSELLYCTDVKVSDLCLHLANAFSQELPGTMMVPGAVDCRSCHHEGINHDSQQHAAPHNNQNVPVVIDKDFYLFFTKDLMIIPIWNKWRQPESAWSKGNMIVLEKLNQFSMNFSKLVNGFRLIIKIPDKLSTVFIQ